MVDPGEVGAGTPVLIHAINTPFTPQSRLDPRFWTWYNPGSDPTSDPVYTALLLGLFPGRPCFSLWISGKIDFSEELTDVIICPPLRITSVYTAAWPGTDPCLTLVNTQIRLPDLHMAITQDIVWCERGISVIMSSSITNVTEYFSQAGFLLCKTTGFTGWL